jgi:protocatechuate 3,4-dioxygenase beta subunit
VRTQIGGRVRDKKGALLAGANVSVEGRAGAEALTDAAGEFSLKGLTPGRLTLKVQNAAGATTLVPIEVPSDSYDIVAD